MTSRGFSLVELLLAIAILGILSGIGLPRLGAWRDRLMVASAVAETRSLLDRARGAAIRLDRPVGLVDSLGGLWLIADTGAVTVALGTPRPTEGVSITGLDRPIRFGRLGLAIGASNRTIVLIRGTIRREIVVSRLGRIR